MTDWKNDLEDVAVDDREEDSCINDNEKHFLFEGIRDYEYRVDGRGPLDYRAVQIELGSVTNASGSAKVRVGTSCVLTALKVSIIQSDRDAPDEGRVEIFVDKSVSTPNMDDEEEDSDLLSMEELQQTLESIYHESGGIDRKKLCISQGNKSWALFFDVIVFEQGTCILDAASLCIKAALADCKFPNVTVVEDEMDQFIVEYSDDPFNFWQMDVTRVPTVTSIFKIGPVLLVDVSREEQVTADSCMILAADMDRNIYYQSSDWHGAQFGFDLLLLEEITEIAAKVCQQINSQLTKTLKALASS